MITASNRMASNGYRLRSRTLPAARKLSTRTPRRWIQTSAFLEDKNGKKRKELRTKVCIIGSGPAAHTAAIYTSRAELDTALFEGWMANGIAPGGQLTTTTYVENFPGFPKPILGIDLVMNMREQSATYGTQIYTETITSVDFQQYPFKLYTDEKEVTADAVIVATGASARKLKFPGSKEFWQKGISACAICDGGSPLFRDRPLAVIGGGDAAMEEACFLTKYASKVYVVHRFNYLEASRIMARKALANPKIEVLWESEVVEAHGSEEGGLEALSVRSNATGATTPLPVSGLFFAIGHTPATKFLAGQLELDQLGYIKTQPGSTATSVDGVFAAGDVQDHRWRQAITAAGSGCMAALEAERWLHDHHMMEDDEALTSAMWAPGADRAAGNGSASLVAK